MTDLDRLIAELFADAPPGGSDNPHVAPVEGQSVSEWLAETAERRSSADEGAIAHRHRIDDANERLFGMLAHARLPRIEVELSHYSTSVPLSAGSLRDLIPALPESAPVHVLPVDGAPAVTSVQVRVTAPPEPGAVIVRFHGGAFWMGGGRVLGEIDRTLLDQVAATANAMVLDVDYRLAPEHPYPDAAIDALSVLDAVRAGLFGGITGPIGLMGTSSGGNQMAMVARIESLRGREVSALGLVVPSLNLASGPQSADADPEAWQVRRDLLRCYLGDIDPADPWISPGVLERLDGMPPTFVAVAEFDEVAAGGAEFCAAIRAAGQDAEARSYPMTHVVATPDVEAAYTRDLAEFFRTHLAD